MNPPTKQAGKADEGLTRGARRRERTREAILDAAERAFARDGYRAAHIERLAEDADVSIGSVYGHFGNKDGLYLATVDRALDLFAEYMQRAYRDDLSPLEQVLAAGDAYLRFHADHPGAFRFFAFDGVETRMPLVDDSDRAAVEKRISAIVERFEQAVQAAVDAGEAAPWVDPFLTTRFLWGAWNGAVAMGLRTDSLVMTEEQIAECLEYGRRVVGEGLSSPGFRGEDGYSRAALARADAPGV